MLLSRYHFRSILALLQLCVLASACREAPAGLRCPAHGGPRWWLVRSAQFELLTDFDEATARENHAELTRLRAALDQVTFDHPREPRRPLRVVHLRNHDDFAKLVDNRLAAGVYVNRLPFELEPHPTVVLDGVPTPQQRRIFAHELVHALVRRNFGPAPPWLDEGLAEYFSTVRVADGQIYSGEPPDTALFTKSIFPRQVTDGKVVRIAMPLDSLPKVNDLIAATPDTFYVTPKAKNATQDEKLLQRAHYLGAWLLVHYLMNGPEEVRGRFNVYLRLAEEGAPLDECFRIAFAGRTPEEMDRELRGYALQLEANVWRRPVHLEGNDSTPSVERVGEAELHLLWAQLLRTSSESQREVLPNLDEALNAQPSSPEVHRMRALYFLSNGDLVNARLEVDGALAQDARSARSLYVHLKVSAAEDKQAQEGNRRLAAAEELARVAEAPEQLNDVAWVFYENRLAARALPYALRALARDPMSPAILDTYATLLFEKGRLELAYRTEMRAVSLLPPHGERSALVSKLARYRLALEQKKKREE